MDNFLIDNFLMDNSQMDNFLGMNSFLDCCFLIIIECVCLIIMECVCLISGIWVYET